MNANAEDWPGLRLAWLSDVGRVRPRNEDALAVLLEGHWLVLSDGMGGHRGGDVASRLAVETLADYASRARESGAEVARSLDLLGAAIDEANAIILRTAAVDDHLLGMGATLVVAIFLPGRLVVGHVGDSRLYRLRRGELLRLTRDHTLLQDHLDNGIITREMAVLSPFRGVLTRALGTEAIVQPDLAAYPTLSEDVYLLCSDGLTDMVADEELMHFMAATEDLPARVEGMVELANQRGGRDNISLILARLD